MRDSAHQRAEGDGEISSRMLKAAERYAQHGWAILPLHTIVDGACTCTSGKDCEHPGKHPRTPHGVMDATTNLGLIGRWWREWPTANIGIAAGASQLICLDIDPRNGGKDSLEELVAQHGRFFDRTRQQLTGSGGRHILFKHPGDHIRNRQDKSALRPGIDVKADGGYFVAAPSLHASGKRYTWDGLEDQGLCELPDWLKAELVSPNGSRPHAGSKPQGQKILPGRRHSALLSYAGKLRHAGCGYEELLSALLAYNRQWCDPPKPESDLRKLAEDVFNRYEAGPSSKPEILEAQNALDLVALPLDEPKWVVQNLISDGVYLLAGRPKLGKSYFALQGALTVAGGHDFLGYSCIRGRVAFFDLEGGQRRMRKRLHQLSPDREGLSNVDLFYELGTLTGTGRVQLENLLSDRRYALVVIDTLTAVVSPAHRRDVFRSDYHEMKILRELSRKHEVAFLVVHHTTKLDETRDPVDAVMGTTGTTAGVDGVLVLRREAGHIILHCISRDIERHELALELDLNGRHGWKVLGRADEVRRSRARKDIIELLARVGPSKPKTIASELGKNGSTVRRLLQQMFADGQIAQQGDGTYSLFPMNSMNERGKGDET